MATVEQTVKRGAAPAFIWWTMIAGPLAWAFDLGFSFVLTQHSCLTGHHYVLHVITVVCALIALAGLAAGLRGYAVLPRDAADEGGRPLDRTHFQLLFGIAFSLAFTVVIIASAVPRWILSPCD
ncbi:MAG: hypothetical protein ACRD3P_00830 [Terriglobales bacterium]